MRVDQTGKVPLKEINGITIYVLTDGRFEATVGSNQTIRKDLKQVERVLRERSKTHVEVLDLSPRHIVKALHPVGIVSREGTRWRTSHGDLLDQYHSVYLYTPALKEKLEAFGPRALALEETSAALQREWAEALKAAETLTPEKWEALVAAQAEVEETTTQEELS